MKDFNDSILHSLMLSGYRYLLYYDLDHFALIVPLEREYETDEEGYIIPIQDEQAFEMASGVDQISFYVLP
jgi:hypothetical protein